MVMTAPGGRVGIGQVDMKTVISTDIWEMEEGCFLDELSLYV